MILKNVSFCQNTDFTQNTDSPLHDYRITDEMMKLIRTKCADKHDMTEMANILGVNPRTLTKHLSNFENIYPNKFNDSSICFFCQKAPLPHISERTRQRNMKPIIELVKQLAGAEQKSDQYMLCQVGKRICNLSGKRNLDQTFEKLGEESDNCIGDFKNKVPDKAAILIKVKCMLSKTDYDNLRESLEDYLILPTYRCLELDFCYRH